MCILVTTASRDMRVLNMILLDFELHSFHYLNFQLITIILLTRARISSRPACLPLCIGAFSVSYFKAVCSKIPFHNPFFSLPTFHLSFAVLRSLQEGGWLTGPVIWPDKVSESCLLGLHTSKGCRLLQFRILLRQVLLQLFVDATVPSSCG
jgi:hypothetical protein